MDNDSFISDSKGEDYQAVRASELVSHSCFFVAITDHFKSGLANRNAIFTNGVGILILEIQTSSFIEVDDCGNGVFLTELVYSHNIMC